MICECFFAHCLIFFSLQFCVLSFCFVSFRLKRKLVSWVKAQRTLSYKRCYYDRGTVHQSGDKSDETNAHNVLQLGLIDSRLTLRLNWIAWSANCVYERSRVLHRSDNTMTENINNNKSSSSSSSNNKHSGDITSITHTIAPLKWPYKQLWLL